MNDALAIGHWVAAAVTRLTEQAGGPLGHFSAALDGVIQNATALLLACPPWLAIGALLGLIHWRRRRWGLTLFAAAALVLILRLGYWPASLQTLLQVALASLACMAIGVPLGIAAAHRPRLYRLLHPLLDLMQTVPTFVYLIPALMLFGLGPVPALLATLVFVLPTPVRLTYLGLRGIDPALLDAGAAFGYSRWARLWRVELPAARASLAAALTQSIMLSLSMVVISALVGAEGLGQPVVRALNTADLALGFEAGLVIVLLAILLDRLCQGGGARTFPEESR